jgi:hypothetical protein
MLTPPTMTSLGVDLTYPPEAGLPIFRGWVGVVPDSIKHTQIGSEDPHWHEWKL